MYNNSGNHKQPQSCNSSPEMSPIVGIPQSDMTFATYV